MSPFSVPLTSTLESAVPPSEAGCEMISACCGENVPLYPRPSFMWIGRTSAMRSRGVWPFTHFNRVHFVPPCTVNDEEVDEGIAALDAALDVTDRYSSE